MDLGPDEGSGRFVTNGVEKPGNDQVGFCRCKGILDGEGCKEVAVAVAFCSDRVPEDRLRDTLGWYYRNLKRCLRSWDCS